MQPGCERGLSEGQIKTLQHCLDFGDEMLERGMFGEVELSAWLEMNHTFHTTLMHGARNATLAGFIDRTQQVPLAGARHIAWYTHDQQNFEQTKGAGDSPLDFQRDHAPAMGPRRMLEHIYPAQELVRKYFKDQNVGFDMVPVKL
jgi:DNA-binding GntR family transcriptional regulator